MSTDAPADEESAALFAELQQLNPELKGNAYFDAASGVWDADGLRQDVQKSRADAAKAAAGTTTCASARRVHALDALRTPGALSLF